MRYAPNRGFLYPVLGQREFYYPSKTFSVNLDWDVSDQNIVFWADFDLNVKAINDFIDEQKAICIIWAYCKTTSFREIYRPIEKNLRRVEGSISIHDVRGTIQFHPSILAVEDIIFSLEEANKDFLEQGDFVEISKGRPLAVHKPSNGELDVDSDRATHDIFQLMDEENLEDGTWEIVANTSETIIFLKANQKTRNEFKQTYGKQFLDIPTLYLSAMVEALNEFLRNPYIDGEERPDSTRWTGVIWNKLDKLGIKVKSGYDGANFVKHDDNNSFVTPFWVAQKLLESPLCDYNKFLEKIQVNQEQGTNNDTE